MSNGRYYQDVTVTIKKKDAEEGKYSSDPQVTCMTCALALPTARALESGALTLTRVLENGNTEEAQIPAEDIMFLGVETVDVTEQGVSRIYPGVFFLIRRDGVSKDGEPFEYISVLRGFYKEPEALTLLINNDEGDAFNAVERLFRTKKSRTLTLTDLYEREYRATSLPKSFSEEGAAALFPPLRRHLDRIAEGKRQEVRRVLTRDGVDPDNLPVLPQLAPGNQVHTNPASHMSVQTTIRSDLNNAFTAREATRPATLPDAVKFVEDRFRSRGWPIDQLPILRSEIAQLSAEKLEKVRQKASAGPRPATPRKKRTVVHPGGRF